MHLNTNDNNPIHDDHSSDKEDKHTLSIIKDYEHFIGEALVSGVPMWVLRYYDGMPESYLDDTSDDKQKD